MKLFLQGVLQIVFFKACGVAMENGTVKVVRAGVARSLWRTAFVFAFLPAVIFALFTIWPGNEPVVTPDSPEYLSFAADRPVGYPLFLAGVRLLFGSYAAAVPIQLALLCGAFGLLAWQFYLWSGKFWLSLFFEAMLFLNPGQFLLAHQIMSETLSDVCLALFAAALLKTLTRRDANGIWGLIAATCAAILVRPVNAALIPAALAAILVFGKRRGYLRTTQAFVLFAGLLAAQEATPLIHWQRGDDAALSNPLARGLFQKTIFREWPQSAKTDACEGRLIAVETKAVDDYLAKTPKDVRPYLLQKISDYVRFRVIIPELIDKYHFAHFSGPDDILLCYTLGRMADAPLYFARAAAEQFWNLLMYSTYVSRPTYGRIGEYLDAHPPVLPSPIERQDVEAKLQERAIADMNLDPKFFTTEDVRFDPPKARPQILANGLRVFQGVAAFLMLAGMAILVSRARTKKRFVPFVAVGILGIAFFGELAITAIIEIAFPRYVYPLWPLVCTAIALMLPTLGKRPSSVGSKSRRKVREH